MQREAHTSVHTHIDIQSSQCSHHCLHSDPHVHTSESQVQTSESQCMPPCVSVSYPTCLRRLESWYLWHVFVFAPTISR